MDVNASDDSDAFVCGCACVCACVQNWINSTYCKIVPCLEVGAQPRTLQVSLESFVSIQQEQQIATG